MKTSILNIFQKLRAIVLLIVFIFSSINSKADNLHQQINNVVLQNMINNYLASYRIVNHQSAISMAVSCLNTESVTVFAGTTEYGGAIPIDSNSVFQIGSTTKTFLDIVFLQLASERKYHFSLDDKLGKWLPGLYPNWDSIPIRALMNMSVGIPEYLENKGVIYSKFSKVQLENYIEPKSILDKVYLSSNKLSCNPGKCWKYNNTTYLLLGLLIPKITGNPNDTAQSEIEKRVIDKLKLKHTYFIKNFADEVVPAKQIVHGYRGESEGISFPAVGTDTNIFSASIFGTAGGMMSTMGDMNIFLRALFTPGVLLTTTQLKDLTTVVSAGSPPNGGKFIKNINKDDRIGYGLGVFAIYYPPYGIVYSYGGTTWGFQFSYWYFPKMGILIANVGNSNSYQAGITMSDLELRAYKYLESVCKY